MGVLTFPFVPFHVGAHTSNKSGTFLAGSKYRTFLRGGGVQSAQNAPSAGSLPRLAEIYRLLNWMSRMKSGELADGFGSTDGKTVESRQSHVSLTLSSRKKMLLRAHSTMEKSVWSAILHMRPKVLSFSCLPRLACSCCR